MKASRNGFAARITAAAAFVGIAGSAAYAEFVVQPAGWHSYVSTTDGRVRDDKLRAEFERAFDAGIGAVGNRDDLVVTMGQCWGGGMLDDLSTAPWSSLNSAARHNEQSWSTDGPEKSRRGAYVDQWARAVDNAVNPTMLAAATTARANDPAGPVLKTYQTTYGAKFLEHPQYTSSGGVGDAIKLRDSTPAKAIVFGGSEANWVNFNSVKQVYSALKTRYGYADADIYVCYGAATDPDGGALPFVRDNGATKADLAAAFTWLDGLTTATSKPDVLYWNAQMHGSRAKDAKATIPSGSSSASFDLDAEFIIDYDSLDDSVTSRWLHLEYTGLSPGNTLYLNGQEVASLADGDGDIDIELDPQALTLLAAGNTLDIFGSNSFDYFSAIEIGMTASGVMVPEPTSILLLMFGAIAGFRRR